MRRTPIIALILAPFVLWAVVMAFSRVLLPLGELSKQAVRAIACVSGLPVAEKSDSMELCFAGEGDYRRALDPGDVPGGPILDGGGHVLGRHDGIHHFTVGQRRGLRVAAGKPLYVSHICPDDHSITVGSRAEASRRRMTAESVHVLEPQRLRAGERLRGKIRSGGEPEACEIVEVQGSSLTIAFDEPQFAPAPGQHLVLYDADDQVVAGGVLASALGVEAVTRPAGSTHAESLNVPSGREPSPALLSTASSPSKTGL